MASVSDEMATLDPHFMRAVHALLDHVAPQSIVLDEIATATADAAAASRVLDLLQHHAAPARAAAKRALMRLGDPRVMVGMRESDRALSFALLLAILYGVWMGQKERFTIPDVDARETP